MTRRAVVLARGLGTRMRAADPHAALTPAQAGAADAGLKAMMPLHGRPLLDYALSSLADAGLQHVALIVAPDHARVRDYYERKAPPERLRIDYIVQPEALGTANAMLCAESWCAAEAFLALNSDNIYPVAVLRALADLDEPGLAVFTRDGLIRDSNIPAERIRAFALLQLDASGYLSGIVEKPPQDVDSPYVSMNLWRFDARIFGACRDVPLSARGEYELPEAVGLAVRRGVRFRGLPASGSVLDLSTRADTADVERRLVGWTPRP